MVSVICHFQHTTPLRMAWCTDVQIWDEEARKWYHWNQTLSFLLFCRTTPNQQREKDQLNDVGVVYSWPTQQIKIIRSGRYWSVQVRNYSGNQKWSYKELFNVRVLNIYLPKWCCIMLPSFEDDTMINSWKARKPQVPESHEVLDDPEYQSQDVIDLSPFFMASRY